MYARNWHDLLLIDLKGLTMFLHKLVFISIDIINKHLNNNLISGNRIVNTFSIQQETWTQWKNLKT